jgi:hypothetical protein
MEPVGEYWTGRESRRGRSSTSGKEQHLDSKLPILMPHPEGNKDCAVCSERKGGKWYDLRFICVTCD